MWYCPPRRGERSSDVVSLQQPLPAEQIPDQAVERDTGCFLQGDIPLVACPSFLLPPVSGGTPGTGGPENFPAYFLALETNNMSRPAFLQGYGGAQGWSEDTHGGDGDSILFLRFLMFPDFVIPRCLWLASSLFLHLRGKATHPKCFWTVCVQQLQ